MANARNRPFTTLFLMQSLDGKISTGDVDSLDVDKDFKRITGVKEGLQQYYDLEMKTDKVSLNSGRVMAKIGVNTRTNEPKKIPVSFIIIDSKPHLNEKGIVYLAKWVETLYLVTTNKAHPAFESKKNYPNLEIFFYENEVDLADLLTKMKQKYKVNRITIQSGGTLNARFVREGLVDNISVVIAPLLVGGKDTQSLIGGESLHSEEDLLKIKPLKLIKNETLNNSYIHVKYKVMNMAGVMS